MKLDITEEAANWYIKEMDLKNKKVLIRCDFNVPLWKSVWR